jgi:hypothetical protein
VCADGLTFGESTRRARGDDKCRPSVSVRTPSCSLPITQLVRSRNVPRHCRTRLQPLVFIGGCWTTGSNSSVGKRHETICFCVFPDEFDSRRLHHLATRIASILDEPDRASPECLQFSLFLGPYRLFALMAASINARTLRSFGRLAACFIRKMAGSPATKKVPPATLVSSDSARSPV